MKLTELDLKMLRILNGELPDEKWGGWWTESLEYLSDHGLCTRASNYQITDAGRAALAERSEG